MVASIALAGLFAGVILGYVIGGYRNTLFHENARQRESAIESELANALRQQAEQAQDETDQLRYQNRVLVSRLASLTSTGATVDPQASVAAQEKWEPEKPVPPKLQSVINDILDPETRNQVEADARRMFNDGISEDEIESMLLGAE